MWGDRATQSNSEFYPDQCMVMRSNNSCTREGLEKEHGVMICKGSYSKDLVK